MNIFALYKDDFYTDGTESAVTEFRIDCVLEKFTDNEAKNFVEYLTFTKENGSLKYDFYVFYLAYVSLMCYDG